MWVLGTFLPLMVWLNYIRFGSIIFVWLTFQNICLLQHDNVACLDVLITEHHRSFLDLYPHVDMMHYLLHTPRLIYSNLFYVFNSIVTGLVHFFHHWTVRFKAKQIFQTISFKNLNFKNLPISLAIRHQKLDTINASIRKMRFSQKRTI